MAVDRAERGKSVGSRAGRWAQEQVVGALNDIIRPAIAPALVAGAGLVVAFGTHSHKVSGFVVIGGGALIAGLIGALALALWRLGRLRGHPRQELIDRIDALLNGLSDHASAAVDWDTAQSYNSLLADATAACPSRDFTSLSEAEQVVGAASHLAVNQAGGLRASAGQLRAIVKSDRTPPPAAAPGQV